MTTPLPTSLGSVLPPAQNEFRAVGRIEQLAQLNLVNDQQAGLAENRRSLVEHNRQTERAFRKMVERQCGDSTKAEGDMPEDETITNNLGDTTHHHYHPDAAKKKPGGGLLPMAIASGAGLLTGGAGATLGALLLSGVLGRGQPAATATTPTVEDRAAKIELFYDDPVKGLIPLGGATDKEGVTVKE